MVLEWKRGQNPYVFNSFGILEVGPHTPPNQVVARQKILENRITRGESLQIGGCKIETHDVVTASNVLRDSKLRAFEVLLAHPEVRQQGGNLKELTAALQLKAALPVRRWTLGLVNPLAVFWFLPEPGAEAAMWPPLRDYGLVAVGAPEDVALDIVFDR